MAAMLNAKFSFDASGMTSFRFGHPPKDLLDTTTLDSTKTHPAAHISLTNAPFQFGVTEEVIPSDIRPFVLHPASPDYCDKVEDEAPDEPFKPFQPIDHMRTTYSFGVPRAPAFPKEWEDAFAMLMMQPKHDRCNLTSICGPFNGDLSFESALHAPIPENCNTLKAVVARCWKSLQAVLKQQNEHSGESNLPLIEMCRNHRDALEQLKPSNADDETLCEWLQNVIKCVDPSVHGMAAVITELGILRRSCESLSTLPHVLGNGPVHPFRAKLMNSYMCRIAALYTALATRRTMPLMDSSRWSTLDTIAHYQKISLSCKRNSRSRSLEKTICANAFNVLFPLKYPFHSAWQPHKYSPPPYSPSQWMTTLGEATSIYGQFDSGKALPVIREFYSALTKLGVTSNTKANLSKWLPTSEAYQLLMNPLTQEAIETIASAYYHQFLLTVDPSKLVDAQLLAMTNSRIPTGPPYEYWGAHIRSIGTTASTENAVSYRPKFNVTNPMETSKTIDLEDLPPSPPIVGLHDGESYLVRAMEMANILHERHTYIQIHIKRIGSVIEQYDKGTASFRQVFNMWECSQTYRQLFKVKDVCTEAFIAEVERLACTIEAASFEADTHKKFTEMRTLCDLLGQHDTLRMPPPLEYPPVLLEGRPRELGPLDELTRPRLTQQFERFNMFDNEMNTIEHRLRQMESERQPVYAELTKQLNAWTRFLGVNTWTIAEMTPRDNSAAYVGRLSEKRLDYLKRQVACATKVGAGEWSLALEKIAEFRTIWGEKLPPQDMLKTTVEKIAYDLNADLSYPPSGLKIQDVHPNVIFPRMIYWPSYWKDVRTCAICYEHGPSLFKFCLSTETCCPMSAQMCRSCTLNGLEEKLGNNGVTVDGIPCLMKHCKGHVPDAAIRTYLPEDKQQSYNRLRRDAVVKANPVASWCRTPGCQTNGMDSFLDTSVILRCGTCDALHCESCLEFAHPDESCEAYKERTTDDCLRTDHQTCPRCNVRIHRIDGCPHMQCSQCPNKTHFCYHCGREYLTRDEDATKDAPDPEGMTSRCNSGGCFYKGIGNVEE